MSLPKLLVLDDYEGQLKCRTENGPCLWEARLPAARWEFLDSAAMDGLSHASPKRLT